MPEDHRLSFYETHFQLSFHRSYKWRDRSKGTISIVDITISKVLDIESLVQEGKEIGQANAE